jgi:probable LLM family oxidoreductase
MKKMSFRMMTFLETGLSTEGLMTDHETRINQALEEVKLADQIGLDYYGIGEHHRSDYAATSPEIILAAAATITNQIHLGSAVTVLSSDDPVRVYESYATLDLISNGRAEIIAGRGSFTESFELFGYSLRDYDQLYAEKLDLLLKIRDHENLTWSGKLRAPLKNKTIYPRAKSNLKISIAVGGSYESVLRAANLGLPIVFAIIGGNPLNFRPLVDLYKKTYLENGYKEEDMEIGVAVHGLISSDPDILEKYYPSHHAQFSKIASERGWPNYSKESYMANMKRGPFYVGNKEEVTERLLSLIKGLGFNRLLFHTPGSYMPHEMTMESIRAYGEEVVPKLKKLLENH